MVSVQHSLTMLISEIQHKFREILSMTVFLTVWKKAKVYLSEWYVMHRRISSSKTYPFHLVIAILVNRHHYTRYMDEDIGDKRYQSRIYESLQFARNPMTCSNLTGSFPLENFRSNKNCQKNDVCFPSAVSTAIRLQLPERRLPLDIMRPP